MATETLVRDVLAFPYASDHSIGGQRCTLEIGVRECSRRGSWRCYKVRLVTGRVWVSGRIHGEQIDVYWMRPLPAAFDAEDRAALTAIIRQRLAEIGG